MLSLQVKKGGGMSINSTVTLTKMSEKMAQLILHEYSILCQTVIVTGSKKSMNAKSSWLNMWEKRGQCNQVALFLLILN